MVAFWYDSKAVAKKVDTNKTELDAVIHNLDDKVTRQYSVQREMNDKTNNDVNELQEWKAWQEGYKKGVEDATKK